jgi:DNA repair exonuclease SbcCD ATPase subunit
MKMLSAEDIKIQRLQSEVDKLERELTSYRGRLEIAMENLEASRQQIKTLQAQQQLSQRLLGDHAQALRVLAQIAQGQVEDPVAHARRQLEDLK